MIGTQLFSIRPLWLGGKGIKFHALKIGSGILFTGRRRLLAFWGLASLLSLKLASVLLRGFRGTFQVGLAVYWRKKEKSWRKMWLGRRSRPVCGAWSLAKPLVLTGIMLGSIREIGTLLKIRLLSLWLKFLKVDQCHTTWIRLSLLLFPNALGLIAWTCLGL